MHSESHQQVPVPACPCTAVWSGAEDLPDHLMILSVPICSMGGTASSLRLATGGMRAYHGSSQNKCGRLPQGFSKHGFVSSLPCYRQPLPAGKHSYTVPKASWRAVFWWLGFSVCFVWGLFFFNPLVPPSNMPLVFEAVVASTPASLVLSPEDGPQASAHTAGASAAEWRRPLLATAAP